MEIGLLFRFGGVRINLLRKNMFTFIVVFKYLINAHTHTITT